MALGHLFLAYKMLCLYEWASSGTGENIGYLQQGPQREFSGFAGHHHCVLEIVGRQKNTRQCNPRRERCGAWNKYANRGGLIKLFAMMWRW